MPPWSRAHIRSVEASSDRYVLAVAPFTEARPASAGNALFRCDICTQYLRVEFYLCVQRLPMGMEIRSSFPTTWNPPTVGDAEWVRFEGSGFNIAHEGESGRN
ncbi:uncharacterized protein DNG_05083 [Cephalotrichum gorgonifer]|uniref:Uncharacterized protein n=1 Tax=Cephalotrichum gorgonifer TaxID=2041049 RepID=A0AAE8N047_9PEZI|nr:uncharacterized protein DNG_05083 [Cephalotrichum gorgonifer]